MYGRAGALRTSAPKSAAVDEMSLIAPEAGWYPLVVYRTTGGTAEAVGYTFLWNTGATDAPAVGAPGSKLAFYGAAPNPSTGLSNLSFELPAERHVNLTIFDVGGRRVKQLANRPFGAGRHRVTWDRRSDSGVHASAGVYFARFESNGFVDRKRLVVLD
jgi:hypothetical protein